MRTPNAVAVAMMLLSVVPTIAAAQITAPTGLASRDVAAVATSSRAVPSGPSHGAASSAPSDLDWLAGSAGNLQGRIGAYIDPAGLALAAGGGSTMASAAPRWRDRQPAAGLAVRIGGAMDPFGFSDRSH